MLAGPKSGFEATSSSPLAALLGAGGEVFAVFWCQHE